MSQVDHPRLIKYYESFLEDGVLNIVMEYAPGGDLGEAVAQAAAQVGRAYLEVCLYVHLHL